MLISVFAEYLLVMFTRSRARAERERSRSIEKHRRIEMKQKLAVSEYCNTSYDLRSTMERRGNSGQASNTRANRIISTEVTPVRLFLHEEADQEHIVSRNQVSRISIEVLILGLMFSSIFNLSLMPIRTIIIGQMNEN